MDLSSSSTECNELLKQCEQKNQFNELPHEIVLHISQFLDMKSYVSLKSVNTFMWNLLPNKAPAFLRMCYTRQYNTQSQNDALDILINIVTSSDSSISSSDFVGIFQFLWKQFSLDLSMTDISDISPLEGLEHIDDLVLSNTQISDISVLSSLKQLESIDLENTHVADISVFSSLTKLLVLDLTDCSRVEDISMLLNHPTLEFLHLTGTNVSNSSVLSQLRDRGVQVYGP